MSNSFGGVPTEGQKARAREEALRFWAIVAALALAVVRFQVPTVGHSSAMVFIAFAHMFVGAMLVLLWQRKGRWPLGWFCLGVPTAIEALLFFGLI